MCINVEFSIVYSIALLKQANRLVVAGEWRTWKRPKMFNTLYLVDIKKDEVISEWKDTHIIRTMEKIRYNKKKGKYMIACGLSNGHVKILSCVKSFVCAYHVRANYENIPITKLMITRMGGHPYLITEADTGTIRLWNISSRLIALRNFFFEERKLVAGTFYKSKVVVFIDEYGREVKFYSLLTGELIKMIDIGIRKIIKGITIGHSNKVLLMLDIPKVMYLGIPDPNHKKKVVLD